MDHCEKGWVALWGGIVVPDVHFLCQPWFSAVGIALGCVGCRVSLHIGWQVVCSLT